MPDIAVSYERHPCKFLTFQRQAVTLPFSWSILFLEVVPKLGDSLLF